MDGLIMSIKRDFGFQLQQRVNIPDAETTGRIDAVMDSADGIQYRVCFWKDCVRRIEWLYPSEIESLQLQSRVQSVAK